MAHFALSAVGLDRPGIVAAVTGVLVDHGCNLEDTSMSILRGHFAMMLVVAGPDSLDAGQLEAAVASAAAAHDLVVAVRAIDDTSPALAEGEGWTVSVYGADQPGIVHRVATFLAGVGANIVDLTTRVIGDADRPVYAMVLDVSLPPGVAGSTLQAGLDQLAAELSITCTAHPADVDIL